MSYSNMKALLDYGRAADFERLAIHIQREEPYVLSQDICKMVLILFQVIHPDVRQETVDMILKAEVSEELAGMEKDDENDG